MDRAPALPDQGPGLAPRRRAPFHRDERGPCPQRRFRELLFRYGVPDAAERLPPVPHGHGGIRPGFRPPQPGLRLPARIHYRGPRPDEEMDFDHLPPGKTAHLPADPGHPYPRLARWALVLHHRPHHAEGEHSFSSSASRIRPCSGPRSSPSRTGDFQVGLICSEKQAIDATLRSLASEDPRFGTVADRYWNARGGSYTDGGAFIFTLSKAGNGLQDDLHGQVRSRDTVPVGQKPYDFSSACGRRSRNGRRCGPKKKAVRADEDVSFGFSWRDLLGLGLRERSAPFRAGRWLARLGRGREQAESYELLTRPLDRRYPTGDKRRRSLLQMTSGSLDRIFRAIPLLQRKEERHHVRIDFPTGKALRRPRRARRCWSRMRPAFPPRGRCARPADLRRIRARLDGVHLFRPARDSAFSGAVSVRTRRASASIHTVLPATTSPPVSTASRCTFTGTRQDQLGQILKAGKLVVYGDVGQTFMYGAKGGEVYVIGNAAGRPLINAAGRPRVVINGTALDFLAESFMAGDPYNGGGFVIVNGLSFDDEGVSCPRRPPIRVKPVFPCLRRRHFRPRPPGRSRTSN